MFNFFYKPFISIIKTSQNAAKKTSIKAFKETMTKLKLNSYKNMKFMSEKEKIIDKKNNYNNNMKILGLLNLFTLIILFSIQFFQE